MVVLGGGCNVVTGKCRKQENFVRELSELDPLKIGLGSAGVLGGLYMTLKTPPLWRKVEILKNEVNYYEKQKLNIRVQTDVAFEGVRDALNELEDYMNKIETKYAMKLNFLKTLVMSTFGLDGSHK